MFMFIFMDALLMLGLGLRLGLGLGLGIGLGLGLGGRVVVGMCKGEEEEEGWVEEKRPPRERSRLEEEDRD